MLASQVCAWRPTARVSSISVLGVVEPSVVEREDGGDESGVPVLRNLLELSRKLELKGVLPTGFPHVASGHRRDVANPHGVRPKFPIAPGLGELVQLDGHGELGLEVFWPHQCCAPPSQQRVGQRLVLAEPARHGHRLGA